MKKLLLLFFICYSISINAQDFPGKDAVLLLNQELRIEEAKPASRLTSDMFYNDQKMRRKLGDAKLKTLIGKEFKVAEVIPAGEKYVLKLTNKETGDVFFNYQPEYSFTFPFEVTGGIKWPNGYLCKNIKKSEDKFTGKINYIAPDYDGIYLEKIINETNNGIFFYARSYGATASVGEQGVIILLKNGSKITKADAKISVSAASSGYTYSTGFYLNKDDIKLLKESEISDIRLYIYDKKVYNGNFLQAYLNCLTSIES